MQPRRAGDRSGEPAMNEGAEPEVLGAMTFAAVLTAVTCARAFVRQTLRRAGLDQVRHDAELVMSELVTNAVEASGVANVSPSWTELRDVPMIEVRLRWSGRSVLVEVWDQDPRPPISRAPTLDAEGGRGLFIVGQLCERWDCFYPRSGGKLVWGELTTAVGVPAQPLPRRQRTPWFG
jgi:anti-sigma regulatory factor (Ser/Thr protein kinase)